MMWCKECKKWQPNKHFLLGGAIGWYRYRGVVSRAEDHTPTMPKSEESVNRSIIARQKAIIKTQAEDLAKTEMEKQDLQEMIQADNNIIEAIEAWLHKNLDLSIKDIVVPTAKGKSFSRRK